MTPGPDPAGPARPPSLVGSRWPQAGSFADRRPGRCPGRPWTLEDPIRGPRPRPSGRSCTRSPRRAPRVLLFPPGTPREPRGSSGPGLRPPIAFPARQRAGNGPLWPADGKGAFSLTGQPARPAWRPDPGLQGQGRVPLPFRQHGHRDPSLSHPLPTQRRLLALHGRSGLLAPQGPALSLLGRTWTAPQAPGIPRGGDPKRASPRETAKGVGGWTQATGIPKRPVGFRGNPALEYRRMLLRTIRNPGDSRESSSANSEDRPLCPGLRPPLLGVGATPPNADK